MRERRFYRAEFGFQVVALVRVILLHDLRVDRIQLLFESSDVFR